MNILFVADNFAYGTDGATVSARRYREELIKCGHRVRVIGIGLQGEDMYSLKEHYLPFATNIFHRNGMHIAKFDKATVLKALDGVDIVHLFFPWKVERKIKALAESLGIPVSAAFHVQPENITYNIRLQWMPFLNRFIYFLFKIWLYGKTSYIHCPSAFIARELRKHNYQGRLSVISNGVPAFFHPPETPIPQHGEIINILMTGHMSREKRQDLLIKAALLSKYRDRIQLYFTSYGPMEKQYMKMGASLPRPPIHQYFSLPELRQRIYEADLYVHAGEVEIEGMSCLEAISCGKVPVISNSKSSATPQFALDERSLFKPGDAEDLARKIDYWIEHPEERQRMGKKYAAFARTFSIDNAISQFEYFLKSAIDYDNSTVIENSINQRSYQSCPTPIYPAN
jgi:glycosyltransferase involved in cell wall biosynthesis